MNNAEVERSSKSDTRLCIDGFRSLRGFEISLDRGLNVLVGPNGSGKTNFIEFLDFLNNLIDTGAANAVSRAGGVSRVFSQENMKKSSPTITAKVCGVADINPFILNETEQNVFNFDYNIEVKFNREQSVIFVSHESVKFRKLRSFGEKDLENSTVGTIEVFRKIGGLDEDPNFKVGPRLQAKNKRNPLHHRSRTIYNVGRQDDNLFRPYWIGADESLLSARSRVPAIEAVKAAISRGRSFNVVPDRARQPDDLTRGPVIQPDGSGLSATLYHLQLAKKQSKSARPIRLRRIPRDGLDMVLEWTKLVLPEIIDISVVPDPHTGKYLGYLIIGSTGLKIPLQSASDGTLKWLALVCLMVTGAGAHSIEEPENFLHPAMQQYLVDLVREQFSEEDSPGYFILSTHSETIINRCDPSELILFKFKHGVTQCDRLASQESVRNEINKTGFGLGFYYANNSVS